MKFLYIKIIFTEKKAYLHNVKKTTAYTLKKVTVMF